MGWASSLAWAFVPIPPWRMWHHRSARKAASRRLCGAGHGGPGNALTFDRDPRVSRADRTDAAFLLSSRSLLVVGRADHSLLSCATTRRDPHALVLPLPHPAA